MFPPFCFIVLVLSSTTLPHITTEASQEAPVLRIAVPLREGSNMFVRKIDKKPFFRGYSIDVFKKVIDTLPHKPQYEFLGINSSSSGSYDNLVNQVKNGTYDAAVGDITIQAYRAKNVDFTQPYTTSGVSLLVSSQQRKTKNMWSFLDPLTWQLWLACLGFFLLISVIIWLLEHEVRGHHPPPLPYPAGNTLWYFISTMFISNGQRVMSKLARLVVTASFFVILILSQCYTASLASVLTVEQFQPSLIDVPYLLIHNLPVGYQNGSFVEKLLTSMGFKKKNLKGYLTQEDLHQMFRNFSIVAAVDESPYLEPFLKTHCLHYTVTHVIDTGGFGFVFQKGSPLVSNMSLGILELLTNVNGRTSNKTLNAIKQQYFPASKTCSEDNPSHDSKIGIDGLMGLFIIAGGISCLALLVGLRHFYKRIIYKPHEAERRNLDLNPYEIV